MVGVSRTDGVEAMFWSPVSCSFPFFFFFWIPTIIWMCARSMRARWLIWKEIYPGSDLGLMYAPPQAGSWASLSWVVWWLLWAAPHHPGIWILDPQMVAVWRGLEGVALLEEVCHWGRALSFQKTRCFAFALCFLHSAPDVSTLLQLPHLLLVTMLPCHYGDEWMFMSLEPWAQSKPFLL